MKVLITGASGLVGNCLSPALMAAGHDAVALVRRPAGVGSLGWNPASGDLDPSALDGVDAVVHLAGENIAARRWTTRQKARIRDSRVAGTQLLATALAALTTPPQVLVSASAIGYYGNRGALELDESSPPGDDFLAGVCRAWEAATAPAGQRGIRVVHLRTGVVLSTAGGALAKMLTPFRLGLGGRLGDGRQFMSWVALDDLVAIIVGLLTDTPLAGPVNAVAPGAITNGEFTRALGRALHRPTMLPMPAAVARLAFGEMADALLLASTRVRPARLLDAGFRFRWPRIDEALAHVLDPRHEVA